MQIPPTKPGQYTIGQLCLIYGVTQRALRYYEAKDLLEPERDGVYRVYDRKDFHRLKVIVEARGLGLSIAKIRKLLDCYSPSDGGVTQAAQAGEILRERLTEIQTQWTLLSSKLAELEEHLSVTRDESNGTPFSSPSPRLLSRSHHLARL